MSKGSKELLTVTDAVPPTAAVKRTARLSQLPKLNLGALLLPPVWGPAHGQLVTVLFYPLWLLADTCFVNAVFFGGLSLILAVTVFLGTAALTLFYARTAGRTAYLRVADRVTLPRYLARERVWALACGFLALVFLGLASWYNLAIRLPAGPSF